MYFHLVIKVEEEEEEEEVSAAQSHGGKVVEGIN